MTLSSSAAVFGRLIVALLLLLHLPIVRAAAATAPPTTVSGGGNSTSDSGERSSSDSVKGINTSDGSTVEPTSAAANSSSAGTAESPSRDAPTPAASTGPQSSNSSDTGQGSSAAPAPGGRFSFSFNSAFATGCGNILNLVIDVIIMPGGHVRACVHACMAGFVLHAFELTSVRIDANLVHISRTVSLPHCPPLLNSYQMLLSKLALRNPEHVKLGVDSIARLGLCQAWPVPGLCHVLALISIQSATCWTCRELS